MWREGNLVCKTDPLKLDKNWKKRMEEILSIWSLPAFCGFIENGYVTKYIQEGDLQGNVPFTMDDKLVKVVVGYEVRIKTIPIFASAITVGERLGYTLGDITCGNMLYDEMGVYLVDFEVIIPYPLSGSYINIWKNTLNLIWGD